MGKEKAVVLLSGGLDSATALAIAIQSGFKILPLTIDYGQKHIWEIESSKNLIRHFKISSHKVFKLDLSSIGGSALTDDIEVPKNRNNEELYDAGAYEVVNDYKDMLLLINKL